MNFGVKKLPFSRTVMDGCMMFCDIVSHISGDRAPIVVELSLGCSTEDTVELHVHGLESTPCNVFGYDASCCCVIGLHRSWGLLVSHFFEGMTCWDGLTAVDEESSYF